MTFVIVATVCLRRAAAASQKKITAGVLSRSAISVLVGILLGFDIMAVCDLLYGTALLPGVLSETAYAYLLVSISLLILVPGIAPFLERRLNFTSA